MIATIHQLYFLPWLGYFNKLIHSDNFIILDDVNFRIRYYHNRVQIINMNNLTQWLTLSTGSNYGKKFNEVNVVDKKATKKVLMTIEHSYKKTKFLNAILKPIENAINDGYPNLFEINMNLLYAMLDVLEIKNLKIYKSSTFYSGTDSTDRLISSCVHTRSNVLIMGEGGSYECHDIDRIRKSKIRIYNQKFHSIHPKYTQKEKNKFVPGLSIVDALCNVGPIEVRNIIEKTWNPFVLE